MSRSGSTTEQLRNDIDSGIAGDKVRVGDPAAAPLGTDEEAAGTPVAGATVAQARRYETLRGEQVRAQKKRLPSLTVIAIGTAVMIAVFLAVVWS